MAMNANNNDEMWSLLEKTVVDMEMTFGKPRFLLAEMALGLCEKLVKTDYILLNPSKGEQLRKLLGRVAKYSEENQTYIMKSVTNYFLEKHFATGLGEGDWKEIVWRAKRSGVQSGLSCIVYQGTPREDVYYIKSHQYGPTSSNPHCQRSPDLKEIFVYKLLQYIGIGPDADFIIPSIGSKRALYIITREVKVALLSTLTEVSANTVSLVQIDLISRILCLRDCATNKSNCGQVNEKPMIVDFRIESQPFGYFKHDIVEKFYEGNGEFDYKELIKSAILESSVEVKRSALAESITHWDFHTNVDKALNDSLYLKSRAKLNGVEVEDDLEIYVRDIRKNMDALIRSM